MGLIWAVEWCIKRMQHTAAKAFHFELFLAVNLYPGKDTIYCEMVLMLPYEESQPARPESVALDKYLRTVRFKARGLLAVNLPTQQSRNRTG